MAETEMGPEEFIKAIRDYLWVMINSGNAGISFTKTRCLEDDLAKACDAIDALLRQRDTLRDAGERVLRWWKEDCITSTWPHSPMDELEAALAEEKPSEIERLHYIITDVKLTEDYREGLIDIAWCTASAGFGHLSFRNEDGQIKCSSEGMTKEFVKSVLSKLVDVAVFDN